MPSKFKEVQPQINVPAIFEVAFMMSEMIQKAKPVWAQAILDLKYTQQQAEAFAEGYAAKLATLPTIMDKLHAIEYCEDHCLRAGCKAANIDRKQVLKRRQAQRKAQAKLRKA